MSKRVNGAARSVAAPEPKKRRGGPSGAPGSHRNKARPLRAPKAFFALCDSAVDLGIYDGFSDWARHHLAIAAADELGIDPLTALKTLDDK